MKKRIFAFVMVLAMLASLVLSGYSYADRKPVRSEAAEEDTAEEDTAAEEEEETGTEYTFGGFSVVLPESDYEAYDSGDDYCLLQTEGGERMLQFLVQETGEEEPLTEERTKEIFEEALDDLLGDAEVEGESRKSFFELNGMAACRTSFTMYNPDAEADYDVDVTLLAGDTSLLVIASAIDVESLDAAYIRFVDELICSASYLDAEEEDTEDAAEEEDTEDAEAEDDTEAAVVPEGAYEMTLGDTVKVEGLVELTVDSYEFVDGELIPSNTEDYYSSEEDISDETYIVVRGTVKNLAGETINIRSNTRNQFTVNGTYKYTGTVTAEDDKHTSFYGYEVKPLKTADFVYYVSVPDELVEMYEYGELELSFWNLTSTSNEPDYKLYLRLED